MVDMLVYMVRKREKTVAEIEKDMPKFIATQVIKKVSQLQKELGDEFYLA